MVCVVTTRLHGVNSSYRFSDRKNAFYLCLNATQSAIDSFIRCNNFNEVLGSVKRPKCRLQNLVIGGYI